MPTNKPQPIPEGYHTVTPWIVAKGAAQLLEYLKAAFDAVELARLYNEEGLVSHAEVRIGDSVVMLFDSKPDWPPTPCFLRLYVDDGDAVYQKALKAGGTPVTQMTHLSFGDSVGRVRDPFGNIWWIQARVEEVSLEDMGQRAKDQGYLDAMHYVEDSLNREMSHPGDK
jgi:PhnB protein